MTLLVCLLGADQASACSIAQTPTPRAFPLADGVPQNGLFTNGPPARGLDAETPEWWLDGETLELQRVDALSELLGYDVFESRTTLEVGAGLEGIEDGLPANPVVEAPDVSSPKPPELALEVFIVNRPVAGSGGECGSPSDSVRLNVSGGEDSSIDDRTPDAALTLIAFAGRTEAEVEARVQPSGVFGSYDNEELWVSVPLGWNGARTGGEGAWDPREADFQHENLCVAVQVMDAAGNLSGRSETQCVNTLDRTAATTTILPGGCSVGAGRSAPAAVGFGWVAAALLLARRRRRRPGA